MKWKLTSLKLKQKALYIKVKVQKLYLLGLKIYNGIGDRTVIQLNLSLTFDDFYYIELSHHTQSLTRASI